MPPAGTSSTVTFEVMVTGAAPQAEILQPAEAINVTVGQPVQLLGRATDVNEPMGLLPCAMLQWRSSVAADPLPRAGCEAFVSFATTGARLISLAAFDAQGMGTIAVVLVDVRPAPINYGPTLTIGALPPATYAGGHAATATFVVNASATDPEGNTPLTYRWFATTFRPNSSVVVHSARSLLVPASVTSGQLSWKPELTPTKFGTFATLGNSCYDGQQVLLELEVTDSLGNKTTRSLPRFTVYLCILG
jgi:serine protease